MKSSDLGPLIRPGGLTNGWAIRSVPRTAERVGTSIGGGFRVNSAPLFLTQGNKNLFESTRRIRPANALHQALQGAPCRGHCVPFRGGTGGRADRAPDRAHPRYCAEACGLRCPAL